MVNNSLIAFVRPEKFEIEPDVQELVGNFGLGLLRVCCGKTFILKKISNESDRINFQTKVYSSSQKVSAVALFIFAFPVTLPLALICYLVNTHSNSHKQVFDLFEANAIKSASIKQMPEFKWDKSKIYFEKYSKDNETLQRIIKEVCKNVKNPNSYTKIPRAPTGKTPVYYPKEFPKVVFKHSKKQSNERLKQMHAVKKILDEKGIFNLVVPDACHYDEFLIEQKLPVTSDNYINMGIYLGRTKLFDKPVRELTKLFSILDITDLVDIQVHPLSHIEGVKNTVRYDNLPLYIVVEEEKEIGKIGLIDLEHMELEPNPSALLDLARIFPLHLDIIQEEAKKLGMQIDAESMNKQAEIGKKYLKIGFSDHFDWLKQKDVFDNNSLRPFEVSDEILETLTNIVGEELLNLQEGTKEIFIRKKYKLSPVKFHFNGDPKKIARELSARFTKKIIDNIKKQIEEQNKKLKKISEKRIITSELVSLRSFTPKREAIYQGVDTDIDKNSSIVIEQIDYYEHVDIAEQLVYVVIGELVKFDKLFFYDPLYHDRSFFCRCWLRY